MKELLVFTPLEWLLGGVALGLFVIQLLYWLVSYARPLCKARKQQQPDDSVPMPPVSIVVYAKNESDNLSANLPALLAQEYPEYEVIVVNDGSTDESDNVLKRFEQDYGHLYHTYIPEEAKYLSRKKLALTVGIKAANYDVILFTEANCRPMSKTWVASMARQYTEQTDIVLGYCAYAGHDSFMHRFIAYDNLISGLQMLSSALIRRPFTGNGRNLSYRKSLFFRDGGFSKTLSLHAGDDDLFVNKYADRHNTTVSYGGEGITEMMPVEHFKVWKEMKVSRAATQSHYKGGMLSFYRIESVTFFLFLAAVIVGGLVGLNGNWLLTVLVLLLYLLRYIVKTIVLCKSARLLRQVSPIGEVILFEVFRPLFNQYIRFYRLFRGKNDYTFHLG